MNEIVLEKNKKVKFNEDEHRYFVDENELISMTNAIHQFFPKFVANDVAKKLADGDEEKEKELLLSWKIANQVGTAVHYFLEMYAKEDHIPTISEYENKAADIGCSVCDLELPFMAGKQFITDMAKRGWKPFIPEWVVWSSEIGLAGTIDLPMINENNEIFIGDYKCTKGIYKKAFFKKKYVGDDRFGIPIFKYENETAYHPISHIENCNFNIYSLQTSGYRYIIETFYGLKVVGQGLIHLPRKNSMYEFHPTPYLKDDFLSIVNHKT